MEDHRPISLSMGWAVAMYLAVHIPSRFLYDEDNWWALGVALLGSIFGMAHGFLKKKEAKPAEDEMEVNTANQFLVAKQGDRYVIMVPTAAPMTEEEVLGLAAYLVSITGNDERFKVILEAVKNT